MCTKYHGSLLNSPLWDSTKLGILFTPRFLSGIDVVDRMMPWAADNDGFSGFHEARYLTMLQKLTYRPGCRFITAPDIPFKAKETLDLFDEWYPALSAVWSSPDEVEHQPIALVAQNGTEDLEIPWDRMGALFIGGDVPYKMSLAVQDLTREAHARGMWVHLGRVNSEKRLRYAMTAGFDSVDGTGWVRFSNAMLPRGTKTLREPTQLGLDFGADNSAGLA